MCGEASVLFSIQLAVLVPCLLWDTDIKARVPNLDGDKLRKSMTITAVICVGVTMMKLKV